MHPPRAAAVALCALLLLPACGGDKPDPNIAACSDYAAAMKDLDAVFQNSTASQETVLLDFKVKEGLQAAAQRVFGLESRASGPLGGAFRDLGKALIGLSESAEATPAVKAEVASAFTVADSRVKGLCAAASSTK